MTEPLLLYLDQNYLSGMVKRKPAFRELEPVLRAAVARGAVRVPEGEAHRLESAPRPDLPLLALLRELSGGAELPSARPRDGYCRRRLSAALETFPKRRGRPSDRLDVLALASALPVCGLVACDAFMAELVRRAGLDVLFGCEVYGGHRRDVERLTARLEALHS